MKYIHGYNFVSQHNGVLDFSFCPEADAYYIGRASSILVVDRIDFDRFLLWLTQQATMTYHIDTVNRLTKHE
jgi:hypothetical protein